MEQRLGEMGDEQADQFLQDIETIREEVRRVESARATWSKALAHSRAAEA